MMLAASLTNTRLVATVRRFASKPPRYIAARLWQEAHARIERYLAPARVRRMESGRLARLHGHEDVDQWWAKLGGRPYAFPDPDPAALEDLLDEERERVIEQAEKALRHEVDLLGSGAICLGHKIDWHRDYKSGIGWRPAYCRSIRYNHLDRPSDVKFPWELSRMQWMLPLGQAYALTGDERYAAKARMLIDDWIAENPYASSVNWACTMDVALRAMAWTWMFRLFRTAPSWADRGFRGRFLASLYQHGDFTTRHLEKADVNGNHYTADAAGLVFVGCFFGDGDAPRRWADLGWSILEEQIVLQVFPDGVDFEASVPYHRLVQELFLLPAIFRSRCGLPVATCYAERLRAMARFTAAYSRNDGSVPLWGDADDARALPARNAPLNDHRYLIGVAAVFLEDDRLLDSFSGPLTEPGWVLGADKARTLPAREAPRRREPEAFPDGGFYILRSETDHVFFDCGPLGLAGRGGHGHNDLLAFEATLNDVHLVSDCGAYLYTADFRERNAFRSTAYHNTPQVDSQEINRFVRPDYLWFLHDDASFRVESVELTGAVQRVSASHFGYRRLPGEVVVHRSIALHAQDHRLTVEDRFSGTGSHLVEVPLHLAPGVTARHEGSGLALEAGGRRFGLDWDQPDKWELEVGSGRVSPSYGVALPVVRLCWRRTGSLTPLRVTISALA